MGYSPWGHKELDTTKRLSLNHCLQVSGTVGHKHVLCTQQKCAQRCAKAMHINANSSTVLSTPKLETTSSASCEMDKPLAAYPHSKIPHSEEKE